MQKAPSYFIADGSKFNGPAFADGAIYAILHPARRSAIGIDHGLFSERTPSQTGFDSKRTFGRYEIFEDARLRIKKMAHDRRLTAQQTIAQRASGICDIRFNITGIRALKDYADHPAKTLHTA